MTTEEKLSYLTEKLAAKERALAECGGKKASIKQLEKRLKSEISALKDEIKSTELEVLGDFLNRSGVAFEDIREAVNSGLFNKPETKADSTEDALDEQVDHENVSPVTQKDEGNEVVEEDFTNE